MELPPDLPCLTCPARNSLLCSGIADEDLPAFYAIATTIELESGANLLMEGDPTARVYNLRKGQMILSRMSFDGRRQILAFVYGGDYVGHTVSDTYSISADALTDVTACSWERRDIDRMIEQYPALGRQFRKMANAILDNFMDLIFALGRKNALERLASFLLYLASRQERRGQAANPVMLPMTRTDIADFLGLTIETVSRAFGRLKSDGLVTLKTVHIIQIEDLDGLKRLASGGEEDL